MAARNGVTLAVTIAHGLNFRSADLNITYSHQITYPYPHCTRYHCYRFSQFLRHLHGTITVAIIYLMSFFLHQTINSLRTGTMVVLFMAVFLNIAQNLEHSEIQRSLPLPSFPPICPLSLSGMYAARINKPKSICDQGSSPRQCWSLNFASSSFQPSLGPTT